jgi:ABC-type multidrug transport system fused ATPase/permease subunit
MYTDFGYMEEGKLGKAYDFTLMTRLATFLRPYWTLMGVSLILVLVMAGIDLLVPYLTKEAIDRYIVVAARQVVLKGTGVPEEERLRSRYGQELVATKEKGVFLLSPHTLRTMEESDSALFRKKGIVTENRYYLSVYRGTEDDEILRRYPDLIERSGGYWFLPYDRMREVKRADLFHLRRADIGGVLSVALLIFFVLLAHFILNYFQVYLMEVAGQKAMHDLRMKVFDHLQMLPIPFYDRNPVGRLVTRLTNDIQNIHEMFTSVLVYLFKDILLLIGIFVILIQFNLEFALVSFSVLPLIFVTTLFFSRRARDIFREIRFKIAQMNAFFQENFSGIQVVQAFRREEENARRFAAVNEDYFRANMNQISVYSLFVPLIEVLSSGAVGLLIWYGGGKVIQNTITVGVLVAFLAYMRMFFQPIRDLSEKYTILQSAMASMERIFQLLDDPREPLRGHPGRIKEVRGDIEFREVSFSYDGKEKVLKEVSFSVRQGETVAIVGPTGAGKTSLLHLLEGFYEAQEGTILLDGTDLRQLDRESIRSQIGLVMQDTFLFAGDIDENIRLGDREKETREVAEIARIVNADRFIRRLPQGYGTKIGEGGIELSSGEKQLLAFARALYRDPKVLILDEATSHVDPETERLIQEGLARLLRGRTSLVIAHRLSTIQHANRIIVLHRGRVRETGTHRQLMERRGLYFKLTELQGTVSRPLRSGLTK